MRSPFVRIAIASAGGVLSAGRRARAPSGGGCRDDALSRRQLVVDGLQLLVGSLQLFVWQIACSSARERPCSTWFPAPLERAPRRHKPCVDVEHADPPICCCPVARWTHPGRLHAGRTDPKRSRAVARHRRSGRCDECSGPSRSATRRSHRDSPMQSGAGLQRHRQRQDVLVAAALPGADPRQQRERRDRIQLSARRGQGGARPLYAGDRRLSMRQVDREALGHRRVQD